jgi:hypothetical protein
MALPTAYLLETDIQIQVGETPLFLNENIIEVLGYKDPTTTAADGPYGGLSKNMIKTGGTPSELKIFLLDVVTGSRPDAEEGLRLVLLDDAGNRQTPFEVIYIKLGTTVGDEEYMAEIVGDMYRVSNSNHNVIIENFFKDNINNTPAIELRAYPTAP